MALPTIDVRRHGGSLPTARAACVAELIDVHHLDPIDARLHVDGQVLDAVDAAVKGVAPAWGEFCDVAAAALSSIHDVLFGEPIVPVPAQRAA